MPLITPSTAWSSGASSNAMFAALPPSSSVSRLPVPATVRRIILPTSVEPVNAILSTSSCSTRYAPVCAGPGDDVHDPGRQVRLLDHLREQQSAVSGVVSAGFSTTVFPVASAGAIFHAAISSGKFHGMIWPATPIGFGERFGNA